MTEPPRISPTALIYKHVCTAAELQGLVPHSVPLTPDKHDDVEHMALSEGSIVLAFNDGPGKVRANLPRKFGDLPQGSIRTVFILFHRRSGDLEKLDAFETTLVRTVRKNSEGASGIFLSVIVPRRHIDSSYIARRIEELPDKLSLPTRITLVPDYYYNSNKLSHVSVGNVRIVPEAEGAEILASMSAEKNSIGNVYRLDVIAQWLGAEVGDIIEYITPCEVGFDVTYLVVR